MAIVAPWRGWRWRRRRAAGHRLQEDVFERIAAVIHSANLDRMFGGKPVELAQFDIVGKNNFQSTATETGAFGAQALDRFEKNIPLAHFALQALQIRFSFVLQ